MKQQLLKWWPVIAAVIGGLVWLVSTSVDLGRMQQTAETSHAVSITEDSKLHKRIDHTNKKVGKLQQRVNKMQQSQARVEASQTAILKNQDRIIIKIDSLEKQ